LDCPTHHSAKGNASLLLAMIDRFERFCHKCED